MTGLISHVNTALVTFDTTANPPTFTIVDGTPAALVVPQPRIFVLQTSLGLATPDVNFALTRTATGASTVALNTNNITSFSAASKHSMEFTFTAASTPIYGGSVWFDIPSGWDAPVETDKTDVAGRVTATLPGANETRVTVHKDNLVVSGRTITVNIKELAENGTVTILYGANFKKRPKVQDTAKDNLGVIGNYRVGSSTAHFKKRTSDTATIDITNAASGSGSATITARGTKPHQVRAGSEGNHVTVIFTAAGTMDGGRVSLSLPISSDPKAWGPIQSTDSSSKGKNHISIVTYPDTALEDAIYSDYVATAYLDKLGPRGRVTFTLSNTVAQSGIGLAEFVIRSDGGGSGSTLAAVTGEAQTDDEKKANEFGLGKTYSANAGELRLQVVGGDGGSGKVEVSIEQTDEGLSNYDVVQDDGTVVSDVVRRIHAGDDATTLKFTYTPTETLQDAELTFVVPSGWSTPQATDSSKLGYTQVTGTGSAQITFPDYTSPARGLTVPISFIDSARTHIANSGGTIVIEYGYSTGGAKPPTKADMYAFTFKVTGSGGTTAKSIAEQPTVQVYSQASGEGSASVDPTTRYRRRYDRGHDHL